MRGCVAIKLDVTMLSPSVRACFDRWRCPAMPERAAVPVEPGPARRQVHRIHNIRSHVNEYYHRLC
jgi:hypothetical protein